MTLVLVSFDTSPVFHLYAQRGARERERKRERARTSERNTRTHTLFMAPIVDAMVAASLLDTPITASIRAFLAASYLRVCRTNSLLSLDTSVGLF